MPSSKTFIALLSLCVAALAAPVALTRREVPQEHSHEPILVAVKASLNLNNPDGIVDPVFGLLGNAAASQGLGQISDPDCLQQATADQAFTNAKAAGDVDGQVNALLFRALERNTGRVGQASVLCTAIQAVNPEIAAISQHQDAASNNAAATNKAITLELARQIAAVGGNPLDALKAGTFAPGNVNDPTGKGNSCNVLNDAAGCIFSQNLLVEDASVDEIEDAVAGVQPQPPAEEVPDNQCPPVATVTVTAGAGAPTAAPTAAPAPPAATPVNPPAAPVRGNQQKFNGALGGAVAPAVVAGGRGFLVAGSDSFLNLTAALGRSCDIQKNQCANVSNSARGNFSVGDCDAQAAECRALI